MKSFYLLVCTTVQEDINRFTTLKAFCEEKCASLGKGGTYLVDIIVWVNLYFLLADTQTSMYSKTMVGKDRNYNLNGRKSWPKYKMWLSFLCQVLLGTLLFWIQCITIEIVSSKNLIWLPLFRSQMLNPWALKERLSTESQWTLISVLIDNGNFFITIKITTSVTTI